MGGFSGLFGTAGGAAGTGFGGPPAANLTNPVLPGQTAAAYTGTQGSMQAQQGLLAALQNQQGIQNQSNVYGQLQNIVAGGGPNPAQAMLNQATGANVSNQAALMAGQRGAGANVGLLARQAAQQGAATQQQAVGQGASMQAQQSLGALGQAGQLATTQAGQQIGQTNANVAAQQAEQQALLNSQAQFNNAQAGMQSNINQVNAGLAQTEMGGQQGILGGLMNAGGAAAGMGKAEGGEIQKLADGGSAGAFSGSGPQSMFGQFLVSQPNIGSPVMTPISNVNTSAGAQALQSGISSGAKAAFAKKSKDTSTSTSTAPTSSPSVGAGIMQSNPMPDVPSFGAGGNVGSKLKSGGGVPGEPKFKGNNYANDTVKALLSPGEVVIPNSVMQSADPVRGAAQFVQATLAKKKR